VLYSSAPKFGTFFMRHPVYTVVTYILLLASLACGGYSDLIINIINMNAMTAAIYTNFVTNACNKQTT